MTAFLQQTQEAVASELQLGSDNPERRKLLARLQAEITSRGVIDVLRHGLKHDQGYQNAKKNTPDTARLEHDQALQRVMVSLLKDDTELYKHFVQNESFRRFLTDAVFTLTSM